MESIKRLNEICRLSNLVILGKLKNDYQNPLTIDISDLKNASLWGSINLLLLVENLIDKQNFIKLIYPKEKKVRGFLNYIGFTNFLSITANRRPQGKFLNFCLSDDEPVPKEEVYKIGTKVFSIMSTSEFSRFLKTDDGEYHAEIDVTILKEWLDGIEQFIDFPLIKDGEFLSFFGLQLVKNVEEHSNVFIEQDLGTAGFLGMRIVDFKSHKYFDKRLLKTLKRSESTLEVCIGDRGVGIVNSLCKTYCEKSLNYGIDVRFDEDIEENILAFSVHELGTKKKREKRIGSIHALHRILRSLSKYGGALRISSGGIDIIYDLDPETERLSRFQDRIGISPTYSGSAVYINGTQIQILIPLTLAQSKQCKLYPVLENRELFKRNHIVPVMTLFRNHKEISNEVKIKISITTDRLSCVGLNQLIVYDFYGKEWEYEDIVYFLGTQADILSRKRCVVIGISENVVEQISVSEKAFHDIIRGNPEALQKDFFLTLCDKHRILPIITLNNNVNFLGFGGNLAAKRLYMDLFENEDTFIISGPNSELEIFRRANDDIIKVKNGSYYSMLPSDLLLNAKSESIKDSIDNILNKSKAWQRKGQYRLPTSNIMVGEFLWTLPVLENLTYNRQIGKWLAEGVNQKIRPPGYKNLLFLCVTATAEMVARSIAKELHKINIYIINLGYFGAMDDDGLLTEDLLKIPLFIVSDLVRDGHSTKMIMNFFNKRCKDEIIKNEEKGEILGLLSFLHLVNAGDKNNSMTWIENLSFDDFYIDSFFVSKVEKNNFPPGGDKFLIEPFSLKPFKFDILKSNPANDVQLRRRLELAENEKVLRVGHWVSGRHHFRVTTCIPKLIKTQKIGGKILNEIGEICIKENLNHLLVPFHSNIRHIIPKLRQYISIKTGKTIDSTYAVEARALTNTSFYIAPKQIKKMLKQKANEIKNYLVYGSEGNPPEPIRFLILDDAIYSARTLETILRALVRKIKSAYEKINFVMMEPIVDKIIYYAIIDRKGRAKGTLYNSIKNINLYDQNNIRKIVMDNYENEDNFPKVEFKYYNWIALDMPTLNKENCIYCREASWLNYIKNTEKKNFKYISKEIDERLDDIKPYGIESPKFISEYKTKSFIKPFNILGRNYNTLEGALWEVHTRRNRGCPYEELIKIILNIDNSDLNLIKLKVEIYKIIFGEWKKFTANWAHKGKFFDAINEEIENASWAIIKILPEIGGAYAMPDIEGRNELEEILIYAADCLSSMDSENDESGEKTDTLLKSIELTWLYIEHKFRENSKIKYKIDEIKAKIIDKIVHNETDNILTKMACNELKRYLNNDPEHPFIPSILFIMDHTVRAIRSEHKHLLPSLIDRFIKSRKDGPLGENYKIIKFDIDYFTNMLIYFSESLHICCQQERAFQNEVKYQSGILIDRCKDLAEELNSWQGWGNDTERDRKIKLRLEMLAQVFPTENSEIVKSLNKRLTTPLEISNAIIKRNCEYTNIINFIIEEPIKSCKAFLIIPNIDSIISFFENYIDFKSVLDKFDSYVKFSIIEEALYVSFTMETNFSIKEENNRPETGHGIGESSTLPFVLYDIFIKKSEKNIDKHFKISLKFRKGFISNR